MKRLLIIVQLLSIALFAFAQPAPGDLYKEYKWFNESGDCNGALRIGGRLDYQLIEMVENYHGNGVIIPPFDIDLKQAIRAELVVEKMLCHGGTEGLRVRINGNDPLRIPESAHIPAPQSAYAHHFNAIVPVKLKDLKQGPGNSFLFEVDTAGHWWPQNLVYGMILRVYYDPGVLTERGKIIHPEDGGKLGLENQIEFVFPSGQKPEKTDIIACYDGPDLEGDGRYKQWHYSYHKCQIYNHVGTIEGSTTTLSWNTDWIPDQKEDIKLAAMIHTDDGYIYMSEAIVDLELKRPGVSVELCKPYKRPRGWFTRNGEFSERFQIRGRLENAVEARMVFRTWSPGYFNGIYINDFLVFKKEGPKYDYFEHNIPVAELYALEQGENILKTGLTPLYPEGMVHGVEVQWPGIMMLIKYNTEKQSEQ